MKEILALLNQMIELGLDKDRGNMALLKCIIKNPQDETRISMLNRRIGPKVLLNQMFGKPFKQAGEMVQGLIKFALTELGTNVGFNYDEPHCLIAGQTGCGKTVLLMIILAQAMMQNATVWLFSKAKDTRNLLRVSREIMVNDFSGQIRFNPLLQPQGVDPRFWINSFADIFVQAFSLYDGTKNFMLDNLNYLFSRNSLPTIQDLLRIIQAHSYSPMSRFARYQESALNRLNGMIGSFGDTFGYPFITLEDLAKKHVIFEIQGLTSEQQVFIVNVLLTWLFYYKLNNSCNDYHFVGIDDANLIFDKSFEYRPDQGKPIVSHLMSTVRKSRINVIACSQIPHQLGASIHSNSFTKIMFSLANANDVDFMSRGMGIRNQEQLEYCHKLSKREIVVKFSGRYQEPFLAYVPEVPNVQQ